MYVSGAGAKRARRDIRSEGGQALIIFALALAVMLGFVAMTLDVGQYMHERQARQNAADAASLAGAVELPASPDAAISHARQYVLANGLQASDIESITVSTTNSTNDTVNVSLRSSFSWTFGRVLGLLVSDVSANASARAGSPASTARLAPWGVVDDAINWNGSTVLKYDSGNAQNGNFGALAIDGTGAPTYTDTIMNGSGTALCAQGQPSCSNPTTTTEPGNKIGPTRDGVDYLIANTSSACDSKDEVFQLRSDGTYGMSPRCNPWAGASDSKRVILVPVIDSLCNGRCTVTILYFAVFFLNTLDSCTGNDCQVTGQFVKVVSGPDAVMGMFDPESAIRSVKLIS